MKSTHLGEFQEIVLLTIILLHPNAYGVTIQEEIEKRTGRKISRGALHSALTRLREKGYIGSRFGGSTAQRGGRRKRFYHITNAGRAALEEVKQIRDDYWKLITNLG